MLRGWPLHQPLSPRLARAEKLGLRDFALQHSVGLVAAEAPVFANGAHALAIVHGEGGDEPHLGDARSGAAVTRARVGTSHRPPSGPWKRVDHCAIRCGRPRYASSAARGPAHPDRSGTRLRSCHVWRPRLQAHRRTADEMRQLAENGHRTGGLPGPLRILASGGAPADRHDEADYFAVGRQRRRPSSSRPVRRVPTTCAGIPGRFGTIGATPPIRKRSSNCLGSSAAFTFPCIKRMCRMAATSMSNSLMERRDDRAGPGVWRLGAAPGCHRSLRLRGRCRVPK